jgi:hypothetical protein
MHVKQYETTGVVGAIYVGKKVNGMVKSRIYTKQKEHTQHCFTVIMR